MKKWWWLIMLMFICMTASQLQQTAEAAALKASCVPVTASTALNHWHSFQAHDYLSLEVLTCP